jgi:hypothetical protein
MEGMIFVKIWLIARLIVKFQPLAWIIDLLPENMIKWILSVLTGCLRCSMTWIAFIMTGDLIMTAAAALIGEVAWWLENKIKKVDLLWTRKK